MGESTAKLVQRRAKRRKIASKNIQNRRRRKGKWAPTPDSSTEETHLIQEALKLTFKCERLHCRLLPESCVRRQKSWDPEIYEGCMGCSQGLEMAQKISYENRDDKAA